MFEMPMRQKFEEGACLRSVPAFLPSAERRTEGLQKSWGLPFIQSTVEMQIARKSLNRGREFSLRNSLHEPTALHVQKGARCRNICTFKVWRRARKLSVKELQTQGTVQKSIFLLLFWSWSCWASQVMVDSAFSQTYIFIQNQSISGTIFDDKFESEINCHQGYWYLTEKRFAHRWKIGLFAKELYTKQAFLYLSLDCTQFEKSIFLRDVHTASRLIYLPKSCTEVKFMILKKKCTQFED